MVEPQCQRVSLLVAQFLAINLEHQQAIGSTVAVDRCDERVPVISIGLHEDVAPIDLKVVEHLVERDARNLCLEDEWGTRTKQGTGPRHGALLGTEQIYHLLNRELAGVPKLTHERNRIDVADVVSMFDVVILKTVLSVLDGKHVLSRCYFFLVISDFCLRLIGRNVDDALEDVVFDFVPQNHRAVFLDVVARQARTIHRLERLVVHMPVNEVHSVDAIGIVARQATVLVVHSRRGVTRQIELMGAICQQAVLHHIHQIVARVAAARVGVQHIVIVVGEIKRVPKPPAEQATARPRRLLNLVAVFVGKHPRSILAVFLSIRIFDSFRLTAPSGALGQSIRGWHKRKRQTGTGGAHQHARRTCQ